MRLKCRAVCAFVVCGVLALAGCSTGSSSTTPADPSISRVLAVVAAENFWGSIAADLGGKQVRVTNIINSPNADPHDYEATAADGRALASANLVLVNGVGYDTWASKLTAANPNPARALIDVGNLLALPADANPHRWYNPADV
ncbi:MAG: metal ABC transporter substrate-binding protein, partial [Mycobacteriaceae bacterium]